MESLVRMSNGMEAIQQGWIKYSYIFIGVFVVLSIIGVVMIFKKLIDLGFMIIFAGGMSFLMFCVCFKAASIPNEYKMALNATDGYSTEIIATTVVGRTSRECELQKPDGITIFVTYDNDELKLEQGDKCDLFVAKTPEGEIFFKALERN